MQPVRSLPSALIPDGHAAPISVANPTECDSLGAPRHVQFLRSHIKSPRLPRVRRACPSHPRLSQRAPIPATRRARGGQLNAC